MKRYSCKRYSAVAGIILLLTIGCFYAASAAAPPAKPAAQAAGTTTHPADLFNDGKARHFTYKAQDGLTIRYFAIKSSDGVIRAAFDACDVCWQENKGYKQKGDVMVCNNCGRQFKSTRINEVSGGCNPAPLARKIENGKVVISAKDLMEGKKYFPGGKR